MLVVELTSCVLATLKYLLPLLLKAELLNDRWKTIRAGAFKEIKFESAALPDLLNSFVDCKFCLFFFNTYTQRMCYELFHLKNLDLN